MWFLLLFSVTTTVQYGFGQDPCSDTVYTELPDRSKRYPTFRQDAVPLCDRYLPKRWYRAGFQHMPTTAPSLTFCGTLYPYWMNGSLPENGTQKSVTVCQVGFSDHCVKFHTIQVKNCGLYAVYELTSLDSCNSAYCFEPSSICVEDIPRELSVSYLNVSWETFTSTFDDTTIKKHEPTVNLICNFSPISQSGLLYDVTWYIDDTEVPEKLTVSADERTNAILQSGQFRKVNKKAESMIQCVVGAKFKASDDPCITSSSPVFFAGIKLWPTNLRIQRGQSAILNLQLTIPFADQILENNGKELHTPNLDITIASLNDTSFACRKNDEYVNQCGIKIPAFKYSERDKYDTEEWKKTHSITIYNRDNGDYKIDKHLTLRLGTGGTQSTQSKIFDHILLPDVQVEITERSSVWKGKSCGSYTDPNLRTFDGKYYSCQLNGTFVLYRNERYNQEVQEKHFWCHGSATCNCAVAVRSGRDVFTVDVCNGQREIINFPICDDKVLKVQKENDRVYKVILPTGTIVSISIREWRGSFLNIWIIPSPSDVNNTRGLCGNLDGNLADDFMGPNNESYSNNDDFSRSWMVDHTENLLIDSQSVYGRLEPISKTFTRVCMCSNTTGTMKIQCNYGNSKECKFNVGKQFYCILNPTGSNRRKRDLAYMYSRTIGEDISYSTTLSVKRYKRQTIMSFEEARSVCQNEFEKSVPYLTCQQFVTDLGNSSLVNCISDLQITGDVNLTAIHIDATLEQCSTFIVLNSTFQEVQPKVTYEIQTLCPSNCSGNGVCNEGNCTCYPGYAGSDCSFDLLGPPTITHISDFGFCDKSEEDCNDITLYGKYFLENMNTTCYNTRQRIEEDGTLVSVEFFQTSLEERTLFEGFCPLKYSPTPTWVTHFTFNISNDGSRFTEIFKVFTYQSMCQEYRNMSGNVSFIFKDGYCFIDGRCVADGYSNPNNLCDICNVTSDRYNWMFNEGHCFINGKCISNGEVNERNLCEICIPSRNVTSWSFNPDFCFINNVCYFNEEKRENNVCEICNTTENKYGWTFKEGRHCLINGSCVLDGEYDSVQKCKRCNAALNDRDWSLDSDFCFISNTCLRQGTVNNVNSCEVCNITSNTTEWSLDNGNLGCISTTKIITETPMTDTSTEGQVSTEQSTSESWTPTTTITKSMDLTSTSPKLTTDLTSITENYVPTTNPTSLTKSDVSNNDDILAVSIAVPVVAILVVTVVVCAFYFYHRNAVDEEGLGYKKAEYNMTYTGTSSEEHYVEEVKDSKTHSHMS